MMKKNRKIWLHIERNTIAHMDIKLGIKVPIFRQIGSGKNPPLFSRYCPACGGGGGVPGAVLPRDLNIPRYTVLPRAIFT